MPEDYTNLDPTTAMPTFHMGSGWYIFMIISTVLFFAALLYSLYLLVRITKAIEAIIRLDTNVQKLVDRQDTPPGDTDNPKAIRPA